MTRSTLHRWALWLVLLPVALVPWLMGWRIGYDDQRGVVAGSLVTYQSVVKTVATLTESHGTLAVTGRDYTTVAALPDANVAVWEVPAGVTYCEFRFEIDADGNTADVQVWAARHRYNTSAGVEADERFTLAWEFAITGGTQTAYNSNVFADTIDVNEFWASPGVITDSAANRICRFDVDVRGVKYLAFLRTDGDVDANIYVDVAHY